MFRSIRSLFGIGGNKKPVQKTSRFFRSSRIRFETLEDRTAPAAGTSNSVNFLVNQGGEFEFEISNATGTEGPVAPSTNGWDRVLLVNNPLNSAPSSFNFSATLAARYTLTLATRSNTSDGNTPGPMDNFNPNQNYAWRFVKGDNPPNANSTVTGTFDPAAFNIVTSGTFLNAFTGTFSVEFRDTGAPTGPESLFVVYTAPGGAAPVASNGTLAATEDLAATGQLVSSGTNLTYSVVAQPTAAQGTVVVNPTTGAYTFTPAANFSGNASFTFKSNNGLADSNTATVAITVAAANDAPVATNGTLSATEDTPTTGTLAATDIDSAALTYSIVSQNGAQGTVTITNAATGAYSYSPASNFNGPATFTFKASDGTLDSNTGTVTITVGSVNDAPVAAAGTLTTTQNSPKSGTLVALDVEGAPLTYAIVSQANAQGTVVITNAATGAYTYTPNAAFSGSASFTFKASDGTLDSNTATVTITVAANNAPVAQAGTLTTVEDTPATGTLVATDADSPNLVYSIVNQSGAHGTVTVTNAATGAYTYTPDPNYNGPASFIFKANDGSADSNTATVTITVTAVNDSPTATAGTLTTAEDTGTSGTLAANDADGDNLTYTIVSQANAQGVLTLTNPATGAFSYTPAPNFSGPASFTFKVTDGTPTTSVQGLAVQSFAGGFSAIGLDAAAANLVRFNTSTPGTSSTVALGALTAGETLVGIDFRPQTGQLYGLGVNATANNATLYLIDPQTGAATAVGTAGQIAFVDAGGTAIDLPLAAAGYGLDFNPTVDRVRVTTSSGLNFRLNPNNGAPVDADTVAAGNNPDGAINGNAATGVGATAYTNSFGQSLTGGVTTQYTLDAGSDRLFIQTPPNNGTQSTPLVVTLGGNTLNFTDVGGFDIPGDVRVTTSSTAATGLGYAALTVGGVTGLYSINLSTGVATSLGAAGGAGGLSGLAIGDAPAQTSATFALSGSNLVSFNTGVSTIAQTTAITNITAGETLVGIDFRPQNGMLYGLGVNAAANNATLYSISTRTGFAGVVGTASGIQFTTDGVAVVDLPDPAVIGYGFDFNPAADRIRVVAGSLNFRINPNTGGAVDGDNTGATSGTVNGTNPDGATNNGTITVDAAAYTNNQAGTTITTLYTLDAGSDKLFIQNPANSGAQLSGQTITLGGSTLNFTAVNGFDIPAGVNASASNSPVTSGSASAVLNVGGVWGLYSINLANAQATFVGNVGTGDSNTATFTITVTPVNDAPVAVNGTLTTSQNTPTTGTLVATDVENAALTYSIVSQTNAHGTVAITNSATGAYSYTPDLNYSGPASFTFRANDGNIDSNTATITITVSAATNQPPVAANGTLTTAEDTVATGTLVATDPNSPALTYSIVTPPTTGQGTVTITNATTGAYSFTPGLNFNGSTSFTFKANDGVVDSNVATIAITVTPANDAPVTAGGTLNTQPNTAATGTLVANDVDSATLTYTIVAQPPAAQGTVVITNPATGAYSFTPAANFNGTTSFTFKASDGVTDSNTSTVTITVSAPVAGATTTTIVSSLNPSTYGQQVTFTATVGATSGTPTGTVNFFDGATQIGTGTLNGGSATFQISSLSAATHAITAQYVGAPTFLTSTSAAVNQVVNKKALTVTGLTVANKVYDGKTTATINAGSASLGGVVGSDNVTLGTSGATATFDSKNVGLRTATISGLTLSGAAAGNYTISGTQTATATITPKTVTITGLAAQNKVYDGTTAATLMVVGKTGISGVVGGDRVNYNVASAVGTFSDPNVGNGKPVTITGVILSSPPSLNNDAANYVVAPIATTANITPKPLTITANNRSKTQGQAVTFAGTEFTSNGLVAGQTVGSATITSPGAAAGAAAGSYSILISAGTGGTANLSNYNVTYINGTMTVAP